MTVEEAFKQAHVNLDTESCAGFVLITYNKDQTSTTLRSCSDYQVVIAEKLMADIAHSNIFRGQK